MNKINLQRMPSYDEFCEQQKQKQLTESNHISVEVPYWDEAIEKVSQEIQKIAGIDNNHEQKIDWDRLCNYLSSKYVILGRDMINRDQMILAHICDLLFFYYGDSFLNGDIGRSYDTETLGAKALVLSSLADTIYHKIMVMGGIEYETKKEQTPVAKVSLDHCDHCDNELAYDFNCRHVSGFDDFSALLKENIARINDQHQKNALDFCLKKLETAGGLKIDNLMKVVEDEEHNDLKCYLTSLVREYMDDAAVVINEEEERYDKNVIKQAKIMFSNKIVEMLMDKIGKANKKEKGAGK